METDPIQDPTGPIYTMSEPKLKGTLPDDAKSISNETIKKLFKVPTAMEAEWNDESTRAKYWAEVRQNRYKHIYDGFYMKDGQRKDITEEFKYYPFLTDKPLPAEITFFKERLFTLMELHYGPNWKVEPRGELRNQLQNIVNALKSNKRVYAREYSACDTRLNRFEPFERKIEFKTIDKPPLTINISEESFDKALKDRDNVSLKDIIRIQEFGYKSSMEDDPEHFHDPRLQLRHDHNRIITKLLDKMQYLREQDYNNTREVAEKVQYQIREGLRRCLNGGDYAYQNEYWNMGMFDELGEDLDGLLQGDARAWKPILQKFVPKRSYKLYEEWKIFCTKIKRAYDKKARTHYMKKWSLRGELQSIPEGTEEVSDYKRSNKMPKYDDILNAAIAGMQVSKSIVMSRESLIDLAIAVRNPKTVEQGLSALRRFVSAVNNDAYREQLEEMLESWLTKPEDRDGPLKTFFTDEKWFIVTSNDQPLIKYLEDNENEDRVEVAREFYKYNGIQMPLKSIGEGYRYAGDFSENAQKQYLKDIKYLKEKLVESFESDPPKHFKDQINGLIEGVKDEIKNVKVKIAKAKAALEEAARVAEEARKAEVEAARKAEVEAALKREEERIAKEEAAQAQAAEAAKKKTAESDRAARDKKKTDAEAARIAKDAEAAKAKARPGRFQVIEKSKLEKLFEQIKERKLQTTGNVRTVEDKIVISGDFVLHSDEVYNAESVYKNFVDDLDTCDELEVQAYLNRLTPYKKGLEFEYDLDNQEIFLKTTGTRIKFSNPNNVLKTDIILLQSKKGESLLKYFSKPDSELKIKPWGDKKLSDTLLKSFRENAEKALTAMSKVGNDQRRYIHRDIKPDNISIQVSGDVDKEGTVLTEFALFDYDVVVQVANGVPQVGENQRLHQGNGPARMDIPVKITKKILSKDLDRYQMGIVLLQLGRKFNFAGDDNYEPPGSNDKLYWKTKQAKGKKNFWGVFYDEQDDFWEDATKHDAFIDNGRDVDGANKFAEKLNLPANHVQEVFTKFLKKEDELSKNATASDDLSSLKQDLSPSAFVKMQSKPSFMVDTAPERRQAVFEDVSVEYDDFSDAELQELMELSSADEAYEKMSDDQFESLLDEARSRTSSARSTPLNKTAYNSNRSTPINTGYNSNSSSARSTPIKTGYDSKSSSAHSSPISSNRSSPMNTAYNSKSSSAHSSPIGSNRSSPMNAAYSSKSSSAHSSPISSNRSTPIGKVDFDAYNASSTDSNRSTPIGSNASSPISSNRSTPIGKVDFDAYNASSTDSNRSTPIGSNASSPISSNRSTPIGKVDFDAYNASSTDSNRSTPVNSNRSTPLNFSSSESDGGSYNNTSGGSDMEY